jgi:hypothetical protein
MLDGERYEVQTTVEGDVVVIVHNDPEPEMFGGLEWMYNIDEVSVRIEDESRTEAKWFFQAKAKILKIWAEAGK